MLVSLVTSDDVSGFGRRPRGDQSAQFGLDPQTFGLDVKQFSLDPAAFALDPAILGLDPGLFGHG